MTYEFRFEGPASTGARQLLSSIERTVQGHLVRVEDTVGASATAVSTSAMAIDNATSNDGVISLVPCPPGIIGHKPGCYNAIVGESPYAIIGHKPLIAAALTIFVVGLLIGILVARSRRDKVGTEV